MGFGANAAADAVYQLRHGHKLSYEEGHAFRHNLFRDTHLSD
jgi:hypothetical protein